MSTTDIKIPGIGSISKSALRDALNNQLDRTLPRTLTAVDATIGETFYRLPVPANALDITGALTQEYKRRFTTILEELPKKGVYVHQRGAGFTDSVSARPYLNTGAIGPCTVIIGHRINAPNEQQRSAFMAHVDRDQNTASLVDILRIFMESVPAEEMIDIHIYGGRIASTSKDIVFGLLDALYSFSSSGQFVLKSFNALSPNNSNTELTFDTRDGALMGISKIEIEKTLPSTNFFLDSKFRMLGEEYLLEDSSGMAVKAENSTNDALKATARMIRLQYDARSTMSSQPTALPIPYSTAFRNEMSAFISELIIKEAERNVPQGSRKYKREDLIKDMVGLGMPERMELSLKQYLSYKRTTPAVAVSKYNPLIVRATEKCYGQSTSQEVYKILSAWQADFGNQYKEFLIRTGLLIDGGSI